MYLLKIIYLCLLVIIVDCSNVYGNEGSQDSIVVQGSIDSLVINGEDLFVEGWVGVANKNIKVTSISIWLADTLVYNGLFERQQRPDVVRATGRGDWLNSGWRIDSKLPSNLDDGLYSVKVLIALDNGYEVDLPINGQLESITIRRSSFNIMSDRLVQISVLMLFCIGLTIFASKKIAHQISTRILTVCLVSLAFAMGAQVFLYFSPGAMSPDSFLILMQARTGIFEDGHPPLMATIWRQVDEIVPGPIGMLVLHLTLFYGGLYLIFRWGAQRYGYCILPVFFIIGMFPPIIGILGAIWIDIMMVGFFIMAIGVFLAGYANQKDSRRVMLFLSAFVLATLGLAVRHNGAAGAFPLIAFFIFQSMRTQAKTLPRLAFAIGGGIVCTLLVFAGAKQISIWMVDVPKYFWRVGAMYDIAGTSYQEKKYLFSPKVFSGNSLEDVDKLYSPRSVLPLESGVQIHTLPGQPVKEGKSFDVRELELSLNQHLFSNWVEAIVHHPTAYLKHRYDVFASLVTRSPWGLWAPVWESIVPNDLGMVDRPLTKSAYFDDVRSMASQQSVIFVPLLYLLLCAIALIPTLIFGLRFQNDALLLASALFGSGLAHMAGLFFVVHSADFRYSHWMIVATTLGTGFVLLESARAAWKFSVLGSSVIISKEKWLHKSGHLDN